MIGIIIVIILIAINLIIRYSIKKIGVRLKKSKDNFKKEVKNNWTLLKIKTCDCQIIKFDKIINDKDEINKELNLNKDLKANYINNFDAEIKRTKITCVYKADNQKTHEFVEYVDKDSTLVEFKVRYKDYIEVYIPNDYKSDYHYMDLDFLDMPLEEIDSINRYGK